MNCQRNKTRPYQFLWKEIHCLPFSPLDHFLQHLMLPLPAPCLVFEIIFAIAIVAGRWKLLLSLLDLELGILFAEKEPFLQKEVCKFTVFSPRLSIAFANNYHCLNVFI